MVSNDNELVHHLRSEYILLRFPPSETVDDELIVRGQRLSMPDTASTVQCWLGQDNFVAYLDQSGHVCALNGRRSTKVFSHVAVDGHGQLIASTKDDRVMHFSSLDAILADQATLLESKPQPRRIRSIVAGAAHFLILTESPLARVFAYGDNRFGQLGVPPSSSTMTDKSRLHHVDFFDGLEPTTVQASQGGLHSAVITADGSLYVFGDDAKGQCGGHGGHEPACITDDLDEGTIVLDVGLGSAHTCFVTEQESNRYVHYCGTSECRIQSAENAASAWLTRSI